MSRGIERAAEQRAHPLVADARLNQLAGWIADALDARGSPPPFPVIDLWTHHLGLLEPAPHLLVLSQSDASTLEARVSSEVAALLQELRYTHYGLATREQASSVVAVLAFSWRWLELAPVPRRVDPGVSVKLVGRLLYGLHTPELVVSYPDGKSYRAESPAGTQIALVVPTRGRGEHRVELLAKSPLGETVVANFPLYVGVQPAVEVAVQGEPAGDVQQNEAQSSQRLLTLVNADRTRAGLSPLVSDEALSRVADAHNADMHAHGFLGHTSPTTGNADDRVRKAGIRTSLVLENIGRGYSPDEVHRGLMESPGHRQNLLHPQATHVGIGVLLSREDQRTAYLVTEVFGRFASKIDVADAPATLLLGVNRERQRRQLRPLTFDKALAALCTDAARELFAASDLSRQQIVERLNQRAAKAHPPYARLSALLTLVTALDEATTIDALLDPRARGVGLGVAQGSGKDTVENAIAVVALVGY